MKTPNHLTKGKKTLVVIRLNRPKSKELFTGKYGLKKTWIGYDPAVNIFSENSAIVPKEDPIFQKIKLLIEKDQTFHRRLREDKAFHEIFWKLYFLTDTAMDWYPSTPTEEIQMKEIHDAIEGRLECQFAQKLLLGKYYKKMPAQVRNQLLSEANAKMMKAHRFLDTHHPKYRTLENKCFETFSLEFSD